MNESNVATSRKSQPEPEPTREAPIYQPRFDIVENEQELTLFGDLPGLEQHQLDVRYENEQLIIHGKVDGRSDDVKYLRQEYGVGDFHRTFVIGESIDATKITAEVHQGVLTIHLPKSEAVKPKRIEVKSV